MSPITELSLYTTRKYHLFRVCIGITEEIKELMGYSHKGVASTLIGYEEARILMSLGVFFNPRDRSYLSAHSRVARIEKLDGQLYISISSKETPFVVRIKILTMELTDGNSRSELFLAFEITDVILDYLAANDHDERNYLDKLVVGNGDGNDFYDVYVPENLPVLEDVVTLGDVTTISPVKCRALPNPFFEVVFDHVAYDDERNSSDESASDNNDDDDLFFDSYSSNLSDLVVPELNFVDPEFDGIELDLEQDIEEEEEAVSLLKRNDLPYPVFEAHTHRGSHKRFTVCRRYDRDDEDMDDENRCLRWSSLRSDDRRSDKRTIGFERKIPLDVEMLNEPFVPMEETGFQTEKFVGGGLFSTDIDSVLTMLPPIETLSTKDIFQFDIRDWELNDTALGIFKCNEKDCEFCKTLFDCLKLDESMWMEILGILPREGGDCVVVDVPTWNVDTWFSDVGRPFGMDCTLDDWCSSDSYDDFCGSDCTEDVYEDDIAERDDVDGIWYDGYCAVDAMDYEEAEMEYWNTH